MKNSHWRLAKMASDSDEAREILSATLKVVLHQEINGNHLTVTPLFIKEIPTIAKIREGKYKNLHDDILCQKNRLAREFKK